MRMPRIIISSTSTGSVTRAEVGRSIVMRGSMRAARPFGADREMVQPRRSWLPEKQDEPRVDDVIEVRRSRTGPPTGPSDRMLAVRRIRRHRSRGCRASVSADAAGCPIMRRQRGPHATMTENDDDHAHTDTTLASADRRHRGGGCRTGDVRRRGEADEQQRHTQPGHSAPINSGATQDGS